jgi:predicted ATPase
VLHARDFPSAGVRYAQTRHTQGDLLVFTRLALVPLFALSMTFLPEPVQAQFGGLGKVKDRVKQRVQEKVDHETEKALDRVECAATDEKCNAPTVV